MRRMVLLTVLSSLLIASCARTKQIPVDLVEVTGGTFTMGHPGVEWNAPHQVILDTFYMVRYPVTIGEWKVFLRETRLPFKWDWSEPSFVGTFRDTVPTDNCPAQGFNWYYAVAYCNWLSKREGLQPAYEIEGAIKDRKSEPIVTWNKEANGYRLPTDAEWEYAARGGLLSHGYRYAGSDRPDDIALFGQAKSYPVGRMKPNELGLYDMTGDVAAWCWDWFDADPGAWLPRKNPSVDRQADVRKVDEANPDPVKVVRGSNWQYSLWEVFSRSHYSPAYGSWIGIRLVRSAIGAR